MGEELDGGVGLGHQLGSWTEGQAWDECRVTWSVGLGRLQSLTEGRLHQSDGGHGGQA